MSHPLILALSPLTPLLLAVARGSGGRGEGRPVRHGHRAILVYTEGLQTPVRLDTSWNSFSSAKVPLCNPSSSVGSICIGPILHW